MSCRAFAASGIVAAEQLFETFGKRLDALANLGALLGGPVLRGFEFGGQFTRPFPLCSQSLLGPLDHFLQTRDCKGGVPGHQDEEAEVPAEPAARAPRAADATAAKPSASRTARSASIFRFSSTPASRRPDMKRL